MTNPTELEVRIDAVLAMVRKEVLSAMTKHPKPMNGPHEGWAVLFEELDELWDHVKADTGRTAEAGEEAIQIAAMGIRYRLEVTGH